ncbi:MAG: hypothetical protein KZQ58_03955 [gamma proteobacterium symbiont of Bathyaustriella thionipta]|nr:hypothetical protein [gamma proteobacterium symbiont of Bathyaustriella thionipta]
MSIRPQVTRWFEMLVSHEHLGLALEALAETGAVQLEITDDIAHQLDLHDLRQRLRKIDGLRKRYHRYWPEVLEYSVHRLQSPARMLDRVIASLHAWEADTAELTLRLEGLQTQQRELQLLHTAMQKLGALTWAAELLNMDSAVIASRLFLLTAEAGGVVLPLDVLQLRIPQDGHELLLLVTSRSEISTATAELLAKKCRRVQIPPWFMHRPGDPLQQLEEGLQDGLRQLQGVQQQIEQMAEKHNLTQQLGDIEHLNWLLQQLSHLPVSQNFAWITGWSSDQKGALLRQALYQVEADAILDYPSPPVGRIAPVVMHNSPWVRPFEIFARMLGMPSASEADPSSLLAIMVPLLFGYMFADVGHGLVLFAVAMRLHRRWPILRILIPCGLSAMLFGFVFGSLFGLEGLIPALWLHPMDAPLPVLATPLIAGVLILLTGLVLNAFEAFWRAEFSRWLQTDAALLMVYVGTISSLWLVQNLLLAGVGAIWYLLGAYRMGSGKPVVRFFAGLGALIESSLQLLLNTLSFVRVGAFALAHAGLSMAFNVMAEASDSLLIAFVILLLGNVMVLLLEGLVVTIQTTRLILFKFFSNYSA